MSSRTLKTISALRTRFIEKLRWRGGYKLLTVVAHFDAERRQRCEEQIWRLYRYAEEEKVKGASARKKLAFLQRFLKSLGEPVWLRNEYIDSLAALELHLEKLSSQKNPGRKPLTSARVFREIMHMFVPPSNRSRWGRALSREKTDEALADIYELIIGKPVSPESFARMRKRDSAQNKPPE